MNAWDIIYSENKWGKYPEVELVRFVSKNLNKSTVLEIGCGTGANTKMLVDEGNKVIAIDSSFIAIDLIKAKKIGAVCTVADVCEITFDTAMFDAVVDAQCLSHVEDITKALEQVHRVLKPNGKFYSQQFGTGTTTGYFSNKGFVRFTTLADIRFNFAMFSSIEVNTITRTYANGNVFVEYIIIATK